MRKVYGVGMANLMYCNAEEYESMKERGLNISALLCAKHPYHKRIVGYEGNCRKDHPEYLYAVRGNVMALNMVDAECPMFFSDEMIHAGIYFVEDQLAHNRDVVVVCNQGESRSPSMCLLYLMKHGYFDKKLTHSNVFLEFKAIAPNWNPRNGILQYCIEFWNKVKRGEE